MSIDWFQMLGALAGIFGAFLVASSKREDRFIGFVFFGLSNLLLVAWAIQQQAGWFLIMQFCFIITTARGLWKTSSKEDRPS